MSYRSYSAFLTLLVAAPGLSQPVPSAGMEQLASFPATGGGAYTIVTGDFNGDGKPDLATPNYNTNTVSVVLGNGDGTFTPAPGSPFTVGETPDWLAVADFNGDGFADLAVSSAQGTLSILLGSASGAMTAGPRSPMSAGAEPFSVVAGDFNSDGRMDLILSNGSSTLTMFLGQGNGGFNPPTYISTALSCGCALAAGRFTPNGPLDVVAVSQGDNGLVILKGDGLGNFQVGKLIPTGLGPHILAIGDINRDGLEDLVIGDAATAVTTLFGDGQGNFTSGPTATVYSTEGLALVDMNGDGFLDLVTPYNTSFVVSLGDGTGNFTYYPDFFETTNVAAFSSFVAGDFNGDGRQDLGALDAYESKIVVFLGIARNPSTLSLSPEQPLIAVGTPVKLYAGVQATNAFVNPSGMVTFSEGTTVLGMASIVTGYAELTLQNVTLGTHTYTASFLGDSYNLPSSGTTTEMVTQSGPPQLVWGISVTNPAPIYLGQANAMYTITVMALGTAPTNGLYTVSLGLPQGESLVSLSGPGWGCTPEGCTRGDVFTPPATLPPITLTVNVAENAPSPLVTGAYIQAGGAKGVSASDTVNPIAVAPPFGYIDTPLNNTTGVSGAIGVTGWALSIEGIQTVGIWREPGVGESSSGLVFVGNADIVTGSRPDVAKAYTGYPCNNCGFGLQVLTNELPAANSAGLGNGIYNFHAIAVDGIGQSTDLGTRTITVDNANSVLPFGAIDTPADGATISGPAYVNFGWALTPLPNSIPVDGSTIIVFIDDQPIGHPVYDNPRSDIEALFPGYANTSGAVGYFYINTTTLSNGLHQISWVVRDSAGNAAGIGSRYFTVQN